MLSTIWMVALPPPSARASSIKSQSPLSVQRRYWRCTEFHLPSSSGKSRHGAPVRAIQNTASSVRRWSRGGRPRRAPVSTTKGSKNPHSASDKSPRIKADLQAGRSASNHTSPRRGNPLMALSTLPSVSVLRPMPVRVVSFCMGRVSSTPMPLDKHPGSVFACVCKIAPTHGVVAA